MSGLRSLLPPSLRAGRRIGDRLQVLHSRAGPPGSSFPNNIGVRTVAGGAPWALVVAFVTAGLLGTTWLLLRLAERLRSRP